MITKGRDCKGIIVIITTIMVSNDILINRGKTREMTHLYRLPRWKTGATVVVAPVTRVPSVRRRTALPDWSGKSIRLLNCEESSRCSSK